MRLSGACGWMFSCNDTESIIIMKLVMRKVL